MKFSRPLPLASLVVVALAITGIGSAQAEAPRGWLDYTQFEKALEIAKERDRHLAILFGGGSDKVEQYFASFSPLRGMVRLYVGDREVTPAMMPMRRQARARTRKEPCLMIVRPDGRVVGFACARNPERIRDVFRMMSRVESFAKRSEHNIDRALGRAKRGDYADALEDIQEIEKDDAALAKQLRYAWMDDKSREFREKYNREQQRRAKIKEAGGKLDLDPHEERKRNRRNSLTIDPDRGTGFNFHGITKKYRDQFDQMIKDDLVEIRQMIEDDQARRAERELRDLVRQAQGFELVKIASDWLESINADKAPDFKAFAAMLAKEKAAAQKAKAKANAKKNKAKQAEQEKKDDQQPDAQGPAIQAEMPGGL